MEKTFNSTKIVFKEEINMRDFQLILNAVKEWQKNWDDMDLSFKLFPLFCVSIDDKILTNEEKRKWIEELTDIEMFSKIIECIGELQQKFSNWFDEKKKMQSNMNLTK